MMRRKGGRCVVGPDTSEPFEDDPTSEESDHIDY